MTYLQTFCVQHLAFDIAVWRGAFRARAVMFVTQQGMTDRGQVTSDLMRATGFDAYFKMRDAVPDVQASRMRYCALSIKRHPQAALLKSNFSEDQRFIDLAYRPLLELRDQD